METCSLLLESDRTDILGLGSTSIQKKNLETKCNSIPKLIIISLWFGLSGDFTVSDMKELFRYSTIGSFSDALLLLFAQSFNRLSSVVMTEKRVSLEPEVIDTTELLV